MTDLLKNQAARKIAVDMTADPSLTLAKITKALRNGRKNLLRLAPDFSAELDWLKKAEDQLIQQAEKEVLLTLPNQMDFNPTIGECLVSLQALLRKDYVTKAPTSVSGVVNAAVHILTSMTRDISPKASIGAESTHYSAFILGCAGFKSFTAAAGSGAAPPTLYGGAACKAQIAAWKQAFEGDNTAVTVKQMETLRKFFFCMDTASQSDWKQLLKNVIAKRTTTVVKGKGAKDKAAKAAEPASKKAKVAGAPVVDSFDSTKANIMKFFAKK